MATGERDENLASTLTIPQRRGRKDIAGKGGSHGEASASVGEHARREGDEPWPHAAARLKYFHSNLLRRLTSVCGVASPESFIY